MTKLVALSSPGGLEIGHNLDSISTDATGK